MKAIWGLCGVVLSAVTLLAGEYRVLAPVSQGNLTVFPVVTSGETANTKMFLTLDEGIRLGEVVITEMGVGTHGLVRPRFQENDGVWRERQPELPRPRQPQAPNGQVNELSLINNSSQPLLLLAGEIVTGGKQDRVVGKDLIIPAHSAPVALGVFCVEPHRWTEMTMNFKSMGSVMAQPSVRAKALFAQDQQEVWDQVAKTRETFAQGVSAPAAAPIRASSSYAVAMKSAAVGGQIEQKAKPIEQTFDGLIQHLRNENAVGAVAALNGEIIWADVFASQDLLNRYWPKLIRSYAADAFVGGGGARKMAGERQAQAFLDQLDGRHEHVETEPGVYRQTEIEADDYSAFVLKALLPGTGYVVHLAKMKR